MALEREAIITEVTTINMDEHILHSGPISLQEGDMIRLLTQVDDNWLSGELGGKKGFFPVNYVQVSYARIYLRVHYLK